MTTDIVKVENNIFTLFDSEDEKQIIGGLDSLNDKKLVYEVRGEVGISFLLLKQLVLEMAQRGHPLETIFSEVKPMGEGKEKMWYATVKVQNQVTKQITEGLSEAKFYDDKGTYDPFGRTKAHSKAERNAMKKHVPEYIIVKAIEEARKKGNVKKLNSSQEGYIGSPVMAKPGAVDSSGSEFYCTCPHPAPNDKSVCLKCNKINQEHSKKRLSS